MRQFTDFCMVGGKCTNVCKISRLWGALSSLLFNKLLSNLAIVPILGRSFQWCWWILPNLSMSKVEKKNLWKVYWLRVIKRSLLVYYRFHGLNKITVWNETLQLPFVFVTLLGLISSTTKNDLCNMLWLKELCHEIYQTFKQWELPPNWVKHENNSSKH